MLEKSFNFLKSLLNTPTPSGFEAPGQRIWLDYASQYADETSTDAYGNATATYHKGGNPRLMIVGHGDEIGLMVSYISDCGYIYFHSIGGLNPQILKAQRVTIHSAKGPVLGVIGAIAPHLTKKDSGEHKATELSDLFIDIGANSKEEVFQKVRIGDPVTLNNSLELMQNNVAVARAFDNRIGSWAAVETLRLLKESGKSCAAEVIAVSSIMEEIGLRGAQQIAYSVNPDIALVVDVTHATDFPGVDKQKHGDVKLGKGPTLTRGACNHPVVFERLDSIAKQLNIPIQYEATSRTSGTDTDVIFVTRGGIPSGLVSLPNRYMHSPTELVNLKDLEYIPQLFAAFAQSLKEGEQMKVVI